jgi:hypothetical protein
MSQNDFVIANQSAPDFRADLNDALQALASLSSGSTAPSTTYANMLWYDTGANILKMRSEADDVWINIGYLDQTADAFRIFDNTQVVNTSGVQTGLIGDQANSAWEAGTSTTESLVSPAKVKAAIIANGTASLDSLEGITAGGTSRINFGGSVVGGNDSFEVQAGQILQAGSVKFSAEQSTGNSRTTCTMRFKKNGTTFATFTTTSTSPVLREADTSVAFGDALSIEIASNNIDLCFFSNWQLKTSGNYIWPTGFIRSPRTVLL